MLNVVWVLEIKFINTNLLNNQIVTIKKNIEYLSNNKYITELLEKKNKQIQFWINTFFPLNKNDKDSNNKIINEQIKKNTEIQRSEINTFLLNY